MKEHIKVGDIIKWIEPNNESPGWEILHSNVIDHKGVLWVNGCGSVERIISNYEYEVNPGFPYN